MTKKTVTRFVTMVVANVKQYREPFYIQLREALLPFRVELSVLYSEPTPAETSKKDNVQLATPLGRRIPALYFMGGRLIVQLPKLSDIRRADLIVVVQASGYVLNYPLLGLSVLGRKKIAFHGHGYNHQGRPDSFAERVKRRLVNTSDWWFTYTDVTAQYLQSLGVPRSKITVTENAVDTREFRASVDAVTEAEIQAMRTELDLATDDIVGLYCGSLYGAKRIPFLLRVAEHLSSIIPNFRLVVVGAGPQTDLVRRTVDGGGSVRYAGAKFGRDKAICFRLAAVFVHPGALGLAVLDSFAAGLPVVTTADAKHGPEIAYLINHVNSIILPSDEESFAAGVASILGDSDSLRALRIGALESAAHYTVENMVRNTRDGILECLSLQAET